MGAEQAQQQLHGWVAEHADELAIPGVAVGIHHEGDDHYAFHGVTSVENPLDVDIDTLFPIASVDKTFTATALMRLVEQGKVRLEERVRTYVPELTLKDGDAARDVTILHLLNHTAGWDGDALPGGGGGEDALARQVAAMAQLDQVTPLGEGFSYNNASFILASRIVEKVTGEVYETALRKLLLDPLELRDSLFFLKDIMTRRFSVGHIRQEDGSIVTARPWNNPRGAIAATVRDLLAWGRFHLGDGRAPSGQRLLAHESLDQMRRPTSSKATGEAVGLAWHLREIDGVQVAEHTGSGIGQFAACTIVPERGFALASFANCSPNGIAFNQQVVAWALERCLALVDRELEPVELSETELSPYAGAYESNVMTCDVEIEGGGLSMLVKVRPEVLAAAGEEDPGYPPMHLGLLPGEGHGYVISGGPFDGLKGVFTTDDSGAVNGIDVGGRIFGRAREVAH